jgi:acylglycerol lipase
MPEPGIPVKASVCFCHGYGDTCTFFFEGLFRCVLKMFLRERCLDVCLFLKKLLIHCAEIVYGFFIFYSGVARRIAASGYAVFAMDYPSFGLSEGLHGYIPNFDDLVDDVIEHYTQIKGMFDSSII